MKKLTAEKCREMISNINRWFEDDGFISTSAELHLQANQIALPILERQEPQKEQVTLREGLESLRQHVDKCGDYNFEALQAEQQQSGCESCGGNGHVEINHGEAGIEHMTCPKCVGFEQQESEGATNE